MPLARSPARPHASAPIHRLLYWRAGEGAAAQNAFEVVLNALVGMEGVQLQRWTAQATAVRQAQQQEQGSSMPQQDKAPPPGVVDQLQRVTFSDLPALVFLLTKSHPGPAASSPAAGSNTAVVEADAGLQALLDKYAWTRQRAALHLDGWTYALGDFSVRAARAVQAPQQQFLGVVLDVAYEPLGGAGPAAAVLQDFYETIAEAVAAMAGAALRRQPDDCLRHFPPGAEFGPRHRVVQLAQLMTDLLT